MFTKFLDMWNASIELVQQVSANFYGHTLNSISTTDFEMKYLLTTVHGAYVITVSNMTKKKCNISVQSGLREIFNHTYSIRANLKCIQAPYYAVSKAILDYEHQLARLKFVAHLSIKPWYMYTARGLSPVACVHVPSAQ